MTGALLVCMAACFWGTVGVASALMSTSGTMDPAVIGLVRTALGALSLLLAAWMLRLPRLTWRQVPWGLLAIFGVAGAVFQICLFAAFKEVGVTITVAVTVCAPVLIGAATDAIWQRAAPEWGVVLAIIAGSAGVVLAVPEQGPGDTDLVAGLYGGALLAGASGAFAVLAIVARALTKELEPVRTAGLGLAASAVALAAIMALGTGSIDLSSIVLMPGWDLVILLYVGVAATGAAYLAFVFGMQRCSSASAGLAPTLIEPGVAAILAALVLQEHLTLLELGGCGLMMLAMVFIALTERSRAARIAPAAG